MRIAIVYASMHRGNTERVASAMADELSADLLCASDLLPEALASYDMVGFGSGIYYGRHHRSIRRLASLVPGRARAAFVFSTAGLSCLAPVLHTSVRRRLRKTGWTIRGEFSCPGWDRWGPLFLIGGLHRHRPNELDLKRAREFARRMIAERPETIRGEGG